ncbi:MAG: hypothetical protein AB2L13_09175 [Spirochaetota bacterium]
MLFYPGDAVIAFTIKANRAGLQIEMHAIGDAAFDQAVARPHGRAERLPAR